MGGLVLGFEEGDDVYIGERHLFLEEIVTPTRFKVRLEGPMDQIFEVYADQRVEILPEVFIHIGNTGNDRVVKIRFEAPRYVRIVRGKVKRKDDQTGA